jgi:Tfp pilus assembly protein PilF
MVFFIVNLAAQTPPITDLAKVFSVIKSVEGIVEVSEAGTVEWKPAKVNQLLKIGDRLRTGKDGRASVLLTDRSVLRVDERTILQISAPKRKTKKALLDLMSGSVYFFSREKPEDVDFSTPVASGAIRGTEFHLAVAENGDTVLALLDGEVEMGNEAGQVTLRSGEKAEVARGQKPVKTAIIDALNIIQWCLYYPAVLDVDELGLSAAEQEARRDSIAAYRRGELLSALALCPTNATPGSDATCVYSAALRLAAGRVQQAETLLAGLSTPSPLADALRQMVAAVQFKTWTRQAPPKLASEWMAESYYLQSRHQLAEALKAANAAVEKSPSFGFGWVRVAELEFSFGRLAKALTALEKGLQLSPRNPQGLALKGFVLSAQNRPGEAITYFEQAMAVDGALGNAWLGRGLCRIRQGQAEAGREDLQVAATLEPQRALLRSYLGKAFSHIGEPDLADKELRLAKQLDPQDPTSWLYSALLNQQRNRLNEAIRDLEKSQELNDNRRLFRSRLLLDQDRAVRSVNLASIYRDAGLFEVGVREAARAVNYDYANFSTHLFLADSYDALLREQTRSNLRYETVTYSELLLAHLLAPVGAGNLSLNTALRDYVHLFEADRLGLASQTEYYSSGDWFQWGSQYGTFGKSSYALDSYYRSEHGQRPNNDLERLNLSAQFKQQLTPQDSVYLQAFYHKTESGDVFQYYDQSLPTRNGRILRVKDEWEPNLFLGYHREWQPGVHTLFLAGRLEDDLSWTDNNAPIPFIRPAIVGFTPPAGQLPFNVNYGRSLEAYSAELQQIWQTPAQAVIVGGRYQIGWADTTVGLLQPQAFGLPPLVTINQNIESDLERFSVYGYHQWQIIEPLRLTTGLSYDRLDYPRNIDTAPITSRQDDTDLVSPKVGLMFAPLKNTALRALYTRSLGGVFFDQSVRLEPSQIAGFNQAYRSLIPESVVGLVPATEFNTYSVGLDQRFKTGTYLGIEAELLESDGQRTRGALTNSAGGLRFAKEVSKNNCRISMACAILKAWPSI